MKRSKQSVKINGVEYSDLEPVGRFPLWPILIGIWIGFLLTLLAVNLFPTFGCA